MADLRLTLRKQLSNCTTLEDMRRMVDLCEFQQRYCPLGVWAQHNFAVREILSNFAATA